MDQPSAPNTRQTGHPRDGNGRYTRSPETAQRDAEAAEHRARGLSYRAIAAEMGYADHSSARDAVQRALRDAVQEPAEDVRRLELERLDRLHQAAIAVLERRHVTVSNGKVIYLGDEPLEDDAPTLQAIDRLLKIQERRARLLGLDAAAKTEVSGGVRYELVGIDPGTLT